MSMPLPPGLVIPGSLIAPATILPFPYDPQPVSGPYTVTYGSVSAGTTTNQQTVKNNVALGDAIVVAANSNSAATVPIGVTDSQNNSYILASVDVNRSPNGAIFVALNCNPLVAGVDTITVTHASTATVKSMIARGCSGYTGIDQVANPADSNTGTIAANSLTALGAVGDWVVGSLSNGTSGGMPLGWAGGVNQVIGIGPGPFLTMGDNIVQSTAPLSVTNTFTANATWTMLLVALSPTPLVNQQTPLLLPPGLAATPNTISLIVPYSSPASSASPDVNIAGVVANVNVSGQSDNSIAIYSAPSVQFPQSPVLPEPLNFIPAFLGLRQQYTIQPLVPVPGSTANVNVNAQFPDSTPAIYTINNPQQPFSPQLPPSLKFNSSSFALRQQYNTATPDVFVPGSTANVNVAAPNGTVTELIDGVGQVSNVNVVAPAGSIAIYSAPSIQYPQAPVLPNPLNFFPSFIGLRQQYTIAPLVQILGATANVNVSAPFGAGVIIYPYGLQQPFSAQLPPSLQFNPASYVLRQQYNTAGPDVFVPGTTANVNVAAPAGSIFIPASIPPQFPYPPILPNSLQFNPAYAGLRVQYNTGTPVFTQPPGNVNGVTAQVNVVAVAGQTSDTLTGTSANVNVAAIAGSIAIYQTNFLQFPFPPILNASIQFNSSYIALRQQFNTALPDVFEPGTTSNVSVAAPAGTVSESAIGAVANVNVAAIAGSLLITQVQNQPFPFLPLLPPSLRFNPAYTNLRVPYEVIQVSNVVGASGVPANVNVSGQADNSVAEAIPGSVANVNISGQSDNSITESIAGTTGTITVAASGNIINSISGVAGNVIVSAVSGSILISLPAAPVAPVTVIAHGVDINMSGPNVTVSVSAKPGGLEYINNIIWWRVYRGYANWPTW